MAWETVSENAGGGACFTGESRLQIKRVDGTTVLFQDELQVSFLTMFSFALVFFFTSFNLIFAPCRPHWTLSSYTS